MQAAARTRELSFCPRCYAALPSGSPCACGDNPASADAELLARYRAAVDAPRARVLTDRTARLIPAMAALGVVALVSLIAIIVG